MQKRLAELDGLRGLAVMMVVLGHAETGMANGYVGWLSPLQLLSNGETGVRIFFILSGFLITKILMDEFDRTGSVSFIDFYKRRILRIFPAFYTYLIFVTILDVTGVLKVTTMFLFFAAVHLLNYMVALSHLLGVKFPDDVGYPVVGHFWTLSLEEQFYWAWPFALLLILRKRAFFCVPFLICAIPLVRVVSYFLFPETRGQLGMMFHTGSDVILFGCALAICSIRRPAWNRWLILPGWVITGLIILILFVLPRIEQVFDSRVFHKIWAATNYTVESLFITVVIANILAQPEAWYTRLLKWRALVFLGTISYSLYLWQELFCLPFNTTFTGRFPGNLAFALGVACLSYRFIERPFLRAKDKYHAHKTADISPQEKSEK